MATTDPSADYPLKPELDLINYLRQATGTGTTGKYTASSAQAAQAPLINQEGLSGIMTEWLRGNGNFLQNMQQQNQSGLYNSSTRRLVANDLTAQAALKAATANQEIGKANAQLATNAAIENAKMQTLASANNAKVTSKSDQVLNFALAAGTQMLKSSLGKKSDKKTGVVGESENTRDWNIPSDLLGNATGGDPNATDYSNMPDYSGAAMPEAYSSSSGGGDVGAQDYSGMDFGDTSNFNSALSSLISSSADGSNGDGFNFDLSRIFGAPVSGGVNGDGGSLSFDFSNWFS